MFVLEERTMVQNLISWVSVAAGETSVAQLGFSAFWPVLLHALVLSDIGGNT